MTLDEAIAEVRRYLESKYNLVLCTSPEAVETLLHAVASGDLIPLADHKPVAWKYRWKIDGEYVGWRYSDASNAHPLLDGFEEVPLYEAVPDHRLAVARAYQRAYQRAGNLVAVLEFYADLSGEGPWHLPGEDYGRRARAALSAYQENRK